MNNMQFYIIMFQNTLQLHIVLLLLLLIILIEVIISIL